MAELERGLVKKRKKGSTAQSGAPKSKRRHLSPSEASGHAVDVSSKIDDLEAQILESQKNYNRINDLLEYAKNDTDVRVQQKAELALCTVFSHFLTESKIPLDGAIATKENIIGRWLSKRYEQYCDIVLHALLQDSDLQLKLLMQLVKQEVSVAAVNSIWGEGLFSKIVNTLLLQEANVALFEDFVTEHILPHRDTTMYTCRIISGFKNLSSEAIDQIILLLSRISLPSKENEEEDIFLATLPRQSKRKPPSDTTYKKSVEEAWLTVLRNKPNPTQRKHLLDLVPDHIAPWFSKPEMLTDFLTDSFNAGGSESLTALSGMFYLIQHRNLDYPAFYTKVYSLIDAQILHSKQRSRFLRLMVVFLDSTHLPAALVASFMKRLSRLCLFAPPAAIIAIVPWLYNMIKEHPVCAFMIHRHSATSNDNNRTNLLGKDPFLPTALDPLHTHALESSLWEIATLGTHYHPNVAAIASIISAPFTKQAYKMDDFLDYTYEGILDAELSRTLKKPPVVEFQIPKRIFSGDPVGEGEDGNGSLVRRIWDFGC